MLKHLLPPIPAGLLVRQILPAPEGLVIVAASRGGTAAWPDCGAPSAVVHSRYERHLQDLPWQGRPVTLQIQVRRLRCPIQVVSVKPLPSTWSKVRPLRRAAPAGWTISSGTLGRRPLGRHRALDRMVDGRGGGIRRHVRQRRSDAVERQSDCAAAAGLGGRFRADARPPR
ncbi:transposase family protein [Pseudoroseomonas wenyumeiae]